MPSVNPLRSTLSLTQLEDRCNPVVILVTNTQWDAPDPNNPNAPPAPGSMQAAFATAAATPGQDEIVINWFSPQVGNTPTFTVPASGTIEVPEGVVIQAGTGNLFATFKGKTPFNFTHTEPVGATGLEEQSEIIGGVFDNCTVPNANTDDGGAVVVSSGQVRTVNTRFTNNKGLQGGAVRVMPAGTLVLDGDPGRPNADPSGNGGFENTGSRTIFRKNSANRGGAVAASGTVILKRVWFTENDAMSGGAIRVWGGQSAYVETQALPGTKADALFLGNQATGVASGGGAIRFYSTGISTLKDVTFVNNSTAQTDGGALEVANGTVNLTACTLLGNKAQAVGNGGAVAVSGDSVFTDNGSMFKGNLAGGDGGGLYVLGVPVSLTDSTFDTNFADFWFGPAPRPQGQPERRGDAIFIEGDGVNASVLATVTATRVRFNLNGGEGGVAVHISTGGTLNTHSCNFFNNNGITRGRKTPGAALGVYTPDATPGMGDVGLMFNDPV